MVPGKECHTLLKDFEELDRLNQDNPLLSLYHFSLHVSLPQARPCCPLLLSPARISLLYNLLSDICSFWPFEQLSVPAQHIPLSPAPRQQAQDLR